MSRKHLWICESCGDTYATEKDEMPRGWRRTRIWAEGIDSLSRPDKTTWFDGDQCQPCFFALDQAVREYAEARRAPATTDGGADGR